MVIIDQIDQETKTGGPGQTYQPFPTRILESAAKTQ